MIDCNLLVYFEAESFEFILQENRKCELVTLALQDSKSGLPLFCDLLASEVYLVHVEGSNSLCQEKNIKNINVTS